MDAVQQQCEACIKLWLDGGGQTSEATKGALSHLIEEHPKNSLPRRYLARLLFHEAAGAISPGTVGSNSSLQRIQLLTDAYEHAAVATDLSPNSLSCAALRATLAINLLVEESALLTPAQAVTNGPQAGAGPGSNSKAAVEQHSQQQQTSGCTVLDRKCQELLQRFLGSIDACKTALEHPQPVLREPLITFTTSTHTTCDPCSLLVEKIMDCSRAGKLQEVVAEKRSVLTSMQQVLQSCYALLDSTQVPLHSIIRLLQHILRPYGAEQQMLASSRVSSDSSSSAASSSSTPAPQLPASQLHHAAIGELLRLLRPGSNQAYSNAAAAASAAAAVAAAASAAGSAAAAGSGPGPGPAAFPAASSCAAVAQGAAVDADLAPLPLSVEKPWDPPSTAATAAGTKAAAGSTRGGGKGRGGRSRAAGAAAGAGKKRERSRRERFTDVETFWRSCSPQQRLHLLRVPLAPLLATIQQESGVAAAEVLMEGLVLLREQEHSSCYWLCAACDRKFHTARDFNTHLETCHEQLVLAKQQQPLVKGPPGPPGPAPAAAAVAGKQLSAPQQQLPGPFSSNGLPPPAVYVTCGKCQAPVVGTYYARVQVQKQAQQQQQPAALPAAEQEVLDQMHSICIKCYRELSTLLGDAGAERSYSRVTPHAPCSPSSAWSESGSEFISTRDSFSSCPDDAASSGSLSDCDAPRPTAAAARRMQLQQYDTGRSSRGLHEQHTHAHAPQGAFDKQAGTLVVCPERRAQHQRSLAWRAHTSQPGCCSSGAGGTERSAQEQQQEGQQQQQGQGDQAAAPPPNSGIFVFGSSSNSSSTSAAAGAASSSTAGTGSFGPPSPVPPAAAGAASSGHPATSSAAADPQAQSGSMPSPRSRPPAKQQQSSSSSSTLAAYWQQQQLLLCSTDPSAIELLDGLDVVQRAKQLDGNQRRSPPALPPQRHAGPSGGATGRGLGDAGPVTGSKRPASAAASGPCEATGTAAQPSSAGMGSHQSLSPVNTSHAAADGAGAGSSGGNAAAAGDLGPAGVCELDAGGDTGTPSAGNRTWRDWLLPKKLLQWNDDDGEMTHVESPGSSGSGDDVMTSYGVDQAHTGQVHNRTAAAAPAGLDVQGGSAGGCCDPGHSSRSASAACATHSGEGAAAAAGQVGTTQQSAGSAPCSPRTPTAHDSCRGGADACGSACAAVSDPSSSTAGSNKQQHAPAATTTTSSCTKDNAAPATADANTAGAKPDSLGACLAAAAPGVLVDEVMHCMQHLYDADGDLADETLLCLVDFVLRKLNAADYKRINFQGGAAAVLQASRRSSPLQLQQVSPMAAAGAAAAGLSADDCALAAELLSVPELALMCPRAMRATMCCLCSSDLHMALAYIVRQAGTPLACPGPGEIASSYGSDTTGSMTSSSGAGSVTGDEDLGDSSSHSDSQESDEETGCMSLFQLYHLDEEAFRDLAGLLRPGQQRLADASSAAEAAGGKAAAGSKANAQLNRQAQQASAQQAGAAGKGSSGAGSSGGKREQQRERLEPVLLVAPWWLEHLRTSSKAKDASGDAEADIRVLRWVYGNIESAQAEELASRQASLRGGLDRTPALLELYEALAEAWRRMQRVADRQRRLEQLRSRVKAKFADVKTLEEAAQHGTSQQATAFLDALQNSISPAAPHPLIPGLPALPGASSMPAPAAAPAATPAAAADAAGCPPDAAADAAATLEQQKQARAAAIAASAALSPLMQLTTYMTKLAPLYLCEAAVAGVRSAPLLASEASQQYACALLQRELAVLALMEAKLEHDVAVVRQRLQAANERLLAKRGTELVAAEAEQAKLVAEGPASHRKKDLLDKATKETEHRQKLAEVKNRIDAVKAAIAEDENVAASAELAAAEGTTALLHVQDLVRQMNMRLKTLQDFNAQLAALLPPQQAAGQQHAAGALTDSQGAGSSSSCSSAPHTSLDSGDRASAAGCSGGPQAVVMPPPAPASPYVDAHAEWTLRARRLECLMCRVLWVAETIRLFDGQYDTDRVTASNSSSSAAASTAAGAAPGPASQSLAPAAGVQPRFSQPRTTPGDLLSASRWVRGQGEELDASFHAAAEELGLLRSRIQQLACVDLTFDVHGAALNYVRRRIEAASAAAQEMRSQQLLLELAEEEEAAKKASTGPTKQQQQQAQQQLQTQQAAAAAAAADTATAASQEPADKTVRSAVSAGAGSDKAAQPASGRAAKGKKAKQEQAKPAASKPTPKATNAKQQSQLDAAAAQEQAKRDAAERQQALEAARAAREAAIEAELEKRRQELQAMEEAAEAELIRLAEEASLKEQAALKAAAEKERQRKEQQALEPAPAPAPAPAATVKRAGASSAAGPVAQDKASTGVPAGSNTKGRQGRQPAAAAAGIGAPLKDTQVGPAAAAPTAASTAGEQGIAGAGGVRAVNARTPQVTGPGAAQAAARAAKQQGAAKQASSPVAPRGSKLQQTPASSPVPGKKAGRGGQAAAAAATGRGGKAAPVSNASTPSKQQRSKQQQQQQQGRVQQAQPQQATPVMLDFGPTPAEAYAARQAGTAAAASAEAPQGAAAVQDSSVQQDWQSQQQQQQASQVSAASTGSPAAPAPGGEPFGLTAADAVVHMPVSTANSSSHLTLLSQGQDSLTLPGATSSSSIAASAELRSTMFADGSASSSAAGALSSAAPGSAFAPAAATGNSSSSSQAFTADAPLTGFSPAPGGHLLSLGSGHLQFQAAASEAVRTLSGPGGLLQGHTGSGQGFGSSQDLSLGFGGLGSFSRQGSASLQGPELNPGGAGLAGVGSKGAAAMMLGSGVMGTDPAASTPMTAGSSMMTGGAGAAARGHLLPPRPSLSSTAGDTLLGSGALDVPAGIFRQAGAPSGLSIVQLPADSFGGVDSGLEPVSPQLGCSPTGDALHIQSIMSLLDDTGASTAAPAPAAPAGAAANRAAGRQGKKQQQVDQQSKQQPQVQQRGQARQQRGQKQAPQQQQQQQRAAGRGRNSASPGPDAKAPGRDAGSLVAAHPGSSTSSGDLTQPANSSASSSMNGTLSPLRPPGLSVASTASLSSRPSSAGSTSAAAAGDALGAAGQRQQQQKAVPQQASSQLWGGGYGTAAGAGMAHGYSGHTWAGASVPDVGVSSSDTGFGVVGRSAGVAPGLYRGARSGADSGTAAAAAAMAAGGGMWGGMGSQSALHSKASDVGPARDQQRPGSAGRGSYAWSAQATHAQHSNAHMAAAAAAAAATAAVKQAQQQAVAAAAAAAVGSQGSGGLHGRGAAGFGGLYSSVPQDMSALFGVSSASLLSAAAAGGGGGGSLGGLGARPGPYFDAGGFGGLSSTLGGFSGGLGAAHAAAIAGTGAVGSGFGDLSGHWQQQQQQQQAALLRFGGGPGALQQQQLWSQPPNADGSQGVQW